MCLPTNRKFIPSVRGTLNVDIQINSLEKIVQSSGYCPAKPVIALDHASGADGVELVHCGGSKPREASSRNLLEVRTSDITCVKRATLPENEHNPIPVPPQRLNARSPRTSKKQRKSHQRHNKLKFSSLKLFVIPENDDQFCGYLPREGIFKGNHNRFSSTDRETRNFLKPQNYSVATECRFSSFDRMAADTPPLQPLSIPVRA